MSDCDSLTHCIQASVTWIEGRFAEVAEFRVQFLPRVDKVSFVVVYTDYCCGWLNLLVNHFHFLKEPV